jgi:hypothetical protein
MLGAWEARLRPEQVENLIEETERQSGGEYARPGSPG